MLTIDYETEAIVGNPVHNPPKPVGVSIKKEGEKSKYHAWGHPTGNNCSFEEGRAHLLTALHEDKEGYLAHNSPFERAITKKYFGYVQKDSLKVYDSQYSLFLTDPYATTFSLKPSAERVLGLPPDEQDAVKDWVLAHVPGARASDWGAYICRAPGDLVSTYAEGDTDRTRALHDKLHPLILQNGMLESYRREQKLMPILCAATERGVRVDTNALGRDIEFYLQAKTFAEEYIYSRLGQFNIDSDTELANALDRADQITEWVLTPTGRRSTARKNLVGRVKDPLLLQYMAYRGVLATCLGTFAGPWLEKALAFNGRMHAQWNQIRGDRGEGGDMSGTRTGRMSCRDPNLQNVSTDFETLVIPDAIKAMAVAWGLERGYVISPVPLMRKYLLPEIGHIWLKRDFSAQEMRILAHFMEGRLFDAFNANSKTDPHQAVKEMIDEALGGDMPRKYVKITGFGILYGRGVPNLSLALGVDEVKGKSIRDAYYAALPEIRDLSYDVRNRGKRGQYIRTWGGRVYYREPDPARDLSYKLLNYLIQGSAADQTKQAIIDHDATREPHDLLIAPVHDEINISAPIEDEVGAMQTLKTAMNYPRFDVPFESDGFKGENWAELEECE